MQKYIAKPQNLTNRTVYGKIWVRSKLYLTEIIG